MPKPDNLWIAIDFGGTTTKVAFRSPKRSDVVRMAFPTIFHLSTAGGDTEHAITVGEAALPHVASEPRGTICLKKRHIGQRASKQIIASQNSTAEVKTFLLITQFLSSIRKYCEETYLEGASIKTCVFTLSVPYQSLHRVLRDAAYQSGFDSVQFLDDAVCTAMSWYRCMGFRTKKYVLHCDVGGDSTSIVLLKHHHAGFQRVAGGLLCRFGGNLVQRKLFSGFQGYMKKREAESEVLYKLEALKSPFLHQIQTAKETGFQNGVTTVEISLEDIRFPISEKNIDAACGLFTEKLVKKLTFYLNQHENKHQLANTSLVLSGNGWRPSSVLDKIKSRFTGDLHYSHQSEWNAALGAVDLMDLIDTAPSTIVSADPDVQKFQSFYHRAVDGDANAQYHLGHCYAYGIGTPILFEEAFFWLEKAAEQDHSRATYYLAKCFQMGVGTFSDTQRGQELSQRYAELESAKAKHKHKRKPDAKPLITRKSIPNSDPSHLQKTQADVLEQERKILTGKLIGAVVSFLVLLLGGIANASGSKANYVALIGGLSLVFISLLVATAVSITLGSSFLKLYRATNKSGSKRKK